MRIQTVVVLLLAGFSLSGCGYNRIQALDERTEELKSNIGVELTNRNQLIPNLVATVQGAAEFERGTFTEVARARAGLDQARQQVEQAVQRGDVEQMAAADAQVTREIGTFINVAVEAYPQLRATQNFTMLQDQLAESENRISVARRDYNEAVREHNTYVRQFPQAITARVVGAGRKEPYQAPAGVEQPPTVDFSRP
ncbi:LemA family protein [soil metagenome]|jgi:LemA protein|nr:LemA family protein [Gemmatimonadota bacterium]MDQ3605576.1 LemA family protein [Gemmatimonadota bacterium]